MSTMKAYRGRLINFRHPEGGDFSKAFDYFEDGILLVKNGKIVDLGTSQSIIDQGLDPAHCENFGQQLIMPGFVDTHIHAPQLDVIASYGTQLLQWLEHYTFPAELAFADPDHSAHNTQRFLSQVIANGTTTAMVFTTSFKHSVDHIFAAAEAINMRLIAGKVMMNRNAPAGLLDQAQQSQRDNEVLIERWHKQSRLGYALTPRFAGTSTPEQLKLAGDTLKRHPDLWVQTHLSENIDEIQWTMDLFPQASDYLNTYELFDLVGPTTVFAHCVHLSASETERLARNKCGISFCPSSNLFLGSGLFPYAKMKAHNIDIALASDIGGGTSISAFKTMSDAYKVCQLQAYSLSAIEAFYLSTLGAAKTLGLDTHVGCLDIGHDADFIVLNNNNHEFIAQRVEKARGIEEELFVYMTLGDERLVDKTYIAGLPQHHYRQAGDCRKT